MLRWSERENKHLGEPRADCTGWDSNSGPWVGLARHAKHFTKMASVKVEKTTYANHSLTKISLICLACKVLRD